MHLNYLLAFDGIEAAFHCSSSGVIIGSIGCSGGADSQDDIVSEAGMAVIDQLPAMGK